MNKKSCKHSDLACGRCLGARAWAKSYREKNRQRIKANHDRWLLAHPGAGKTHSKSYKDKNREKVRAAGADYYKRNRSKVLAFSKDWGRRNAAARRRYSKAHYDKNPEKLTARSRAYYAKNREASLQRQADWRRKNPKAASAATRRWEENHPEAVREFARARRAAKAALFVEKIDLSEIAKLQAGLCYLCSEPMGDDVTLDHVVPLKSRGPHAPDNAAAAHRRCNSRKGSMSLLRYLVRFGRAA